MQPAKTTAFRLAIKHYTRQIKIDWRYTVPGLLLPGLANILVFYAPPLVIAAILGKFANGGTISGPQVLPYLLAFAGVWLSGELIWRLAIFFLNRAGSRGINSLYKSGLASIIHKDIDFFHDNFAGSLTKSVVGYAQRYETFIDSLAFSIAAELIPLIFVVVVLWSFSPLLVVALLGMMTLTIAILFPLIKRRQKLVVAREAASNTVAGHVADTISNMDAVQSFAREADELNTHAKHVDQYTKQVLRTWDYQNTRIDIITSPLYVLTNVLGLYLALTLGGDNTRNLQAIFVTFSYFSSFTRIVWEFNRVYRNIESSLSEAAQFTKLLLQPESAKRINSLSQTKITAGSIEFRKVSFRYKQAGKFLFTELDINIAAGEHVALVGHSGGGKSSITKLLLGFVKPEKGQILIDNTDISELTVQNLRQNISYVPQEPIMFHRTLLENIRYGQPGASIQDVEDISASAHAHDFIMQLPAKYQTLVGERGVKLSGGQRQRVAIARAMLKDAPVIVLDEATSALDSESERLVQDALWKLMDGRTAIVIAHRLSTIQKMDRILVLEDGKIIESGSHNELLKKQGAYAKLWAHQSGGFIEE